MDKVLSGKPVASLIKKQVKQLITEYGLTPKMALIQVGADPAASYYVQNIINNGSKLGCDVQLFSLPQTTGFDDLVKLIDRVNSDPTIHGIMIQKPLPHDYNDNLLGEMINPDKDLDCLSPLNLGRIILEEDGLLPCTPLAVLYMLYFYQVKVPGTHVVILGRSSIVGKPLADMLLWKKPFANASVTVCHSKTQNLAELTRSADIVVTAMGQAEFLKPEMIKENSLLFDVGINAKKDSADQTIYVGDIDFNACYEKALAITPVPGGVGSVTSALLFLNLVKANLKTIGLNKSIDDFLGLIFNDK